MILHRLASETLQRSTRVRIGETSKTLAMTIVWSLASALATFAAAAADHPVEPVKFGITAAVVRENLDLYERWSAYLERKIGRPVRFVQRRTYREAMELVEIGEHDFSWICSFPYVKHESAGLIGLLAAPVFQGQPLYRSYIIVQRDGAATSLADLKGRVFAYSDPDSNSGYMAPRAMLREKGQNPDNFFRQTFFTYSHTETVEAVAERVADGAAVDSYVWEYLDRHQHALTEKTRVIQQSQTYGFPPLIYRKNVDPTLLRRMTDALMTMEYDKEGRTILDDLMLDRFTEGTPAMYDGVRANFERR